MRWWCLYLDHLFDTLNSILTHPHDTILQSSSMWDVKWLGSHVHVLQKMAELRSFNLLKRLITSDDPFCYIFLKGLQIKWLVLATSPVKKSDGQSVTYCILLQLLRKHGQQVFRSSFHSCKIGVGSLFIQSFFLDVISSPSSVVGSVWSLRMRKSLCMARKCVLRCPTKPKAHLRKSNG